MHLRSNTRVALATILAITTLAALFALTDRSAADASTPRLRGPVIDGDYADPELVVDPATAQYYAYATNISVYGKLFNVPVHSSSNLTSWKFEGDALPNLPSWAQSGASLTWAPGVSNINGKYRLYFTARHRASGRQCIGLATANSAKGPFTPYGNEPLICQTDRGGSIDADPFLDPVTGKQYLYWKSDENAPGASGVSRLWVSELTSDGLRLTGPTKVVLTYGGAGEDPLIENPSMAYANGRYWLKYSANWWESDNYRDHIAVCSSPTSGCSRWGTAVDPWLGAGSGIAGPGGGTWFSDVAGQHYIMFHGWQKAVGYSAGGYRAMFVERVTFDGSNGSPRLRPDLPQTAGSKTAYDSNGNFVRAAYRQFIGRSPSASETAYWQERLRSGGDAGELTGTLARSDEWLRNELDKVYQGAFGRSADAGGRAYWSDYVRAGNRLTDVGVHVYASEEFYKRNGSTNRGFVTGLYKRILGRNADTGGLNHWTNAMANGMSRAEVTQSFYNSIESRRNRVNGLYRDLLGRNADAGGLGYWSEQLLVFDDVKLAEVLAVSGEFYKRAQKIGR